MFGLSKKDFESIVNFVVDVAFDLPQRSPIIPDIDDEDFARAGEETRVSNGGMVQQHECDHETTVCARCISMVPGTKTGSCPTCCNDPDRKVGCGHGSNEPTGGDCKIKRMKSQETLLSPDKAAYVRDELFGTMIPPDAKAMATVKDVKIAALESELEKAKEEIGKYRVLFGKMFYMLKEYK